jgi:rare lipoprotein A
MPRSTMRRAAFAGALCLTATTATTAEAAAPTTAHGPEVSVSAKRLNVRLGGRMTVSGHAQAPGAALQIRRHGQWVTLARTHTSASGWFVLRKRARQPLSAPARVRSSTGATRLLGRLNVYRYAQASWYGPGLFGQRTGCGGRLHAGQLGVANKTLPCGSQVTLRNGRRVVRVPVIDRGPYVGGREFDLTMATAGRLRFRGHGTIQVAS